MSGYPYKSFHELSVEEIDWQRWQKLVNTVANLFAAPAAFVTQASNKGIEVLVASELPTTHYSPGGAAGMDENVYCHYVVQNNLPLYVKNAEQHPEWHSNPEYIQDNYVSYLGYPILWPDGTPFGTLCVMDTQTSDYADQLVNTLELMSEVLNSDLAHLYTESQLRVESRIDPLTGILNRRGFEEAYEQYRRLSHRLGRKAKLCFIDLDDFKKVNDNLGHEMGDKLLQIFAQALTEVTRSTDLVCRWGGDEFVVLFNSDKEINSKRLIARINEFVHQSYPAHTIGFSSGVVALDLKKDNTLERALIDADKAMYQQKLLLK